MSRPITDRPHLRTGGEYQGGAPVVIRHSPPGEREAMDAIGFFCPEPWQRQLWRLSDQLTQATSDWRRRWTDIRDDDWITRRRLTPYPVLLRRLAGAPARG